LPGLGSPNLGAPIWVLGSDCSAISLLWSKQAADPSTTMPQNKFGVACYFPAAEVLLLFRLPLAGRGGEGMEKVGARMSGSGGGGSPSALVRGRDAWRWPASSAPSLTGRGCMGRRVLAVRQAAYSPLFNCGSLLVATSPVGPLFPADRDGEGRTTAGGLPWPADVLRALYGPPGS
jgi:hypothetical protein